MMRLAILILAGFTMQIVGAGILDVGVAAIPAHGEINATIAALGVLAAALLFIGAIARRAISKTQKG